MKTKIECISGYYGSQLLANEALDKYYGGEEGPYWVEEVYPGKWYVVCDYDYVHYTD